MDQAEIIKPGSEPIRPELLRDEAAWWLRRMVPTDRKLEVLNLLARTLAHGRPGKGLRRDIIEKIIEIAPEAGRMNPVAAMEAMSEAFLWFGTDHLPNVAQKILMLEKPAIETNPNVALSALEKILLVCHCVLIPMDLHGTPQEMEACTEWQRQTFASIIGAIEKNPSIDPAVAANVLKVAEMITYVNEKFGDINQKIHVVSHEHDFIGSSWH